MQYCWCWITSLPQQPRRLVSVSLAHDGAVLVITRQTSVCSRIISLYPPWWGWSCPCTGAQEVERRHVALFGRYARSVPSGSRDLVFQSARRTREKTRSLLDRMVRLAILYYFRKPALTLSPLIPWRLYNLPYWSNPPFLIFDIRRSGAQDWVPECQKLKMVG